MDAIAKILTGFGLTQYASIVLGLSIFIDINPRIKWNPLKSLLGFLGTYLNRSIEKEISGFKEEVNRKLEDLQKEQNSQRETLNKIIIDTENRELSKLRWEIIEFDMSISNGQKHTREQYRHILDSGHKFDRMVLSENINVDPEDVRSIQESIANIEKHYEKNRRDLTTVYF